MKRRDKGFTLIELIAVIVVLAVLTVIVVPIVIKQITSSKSNLYLKQVDLIEKASQSWGNENGNLLPGTAEEFVYLSIDDLNEGGYIDRDKVKDPRDGSRMNGCVVISYSELYHQNVYEYKEKPCSELNPGGLPTIVAKGGNPQGVEVNTTYVLPEVTATSDDGTPLKVEGPIIRDKNNKVVEKVSTEKIRDQFKLTYRAMDKASGKEAGKNINVKVIDTIAPVIEVNGRKSSHTITHEIGQPFTVPTPTVTDNSKLECKNDPNSKCHWEVSSNVNPKVVGTYNVTYTATDDGEDMSGPNPNTTVYILTVKVVDLTIPAIKEIVPDITVWTNKNVTLTIIPEDNDEKLQYSFDDGRTWQDSDKKTFTSNQTVTARVKDSSGNVSESKSYTITNIDKIPPTCQTSINYGGRNVTTNGWVNASQAKVTASSPIIINGTCSDQGGSQCVSNVSDKVTGETKGTTISPGTVKDHAGNTTKCSSVMIKVDQTNPSCAVSVDYKGRTTYNGWVNASQAKVTASNPIVVKGTCSDNVSGCAANASSNVTGETNGSNVSPGTVKDNAGNATTCGTKLIKVDQTKPTCGTSVNYGGRSLTSSGWINAGQAKVTSSSPITVTGTCNDNGSKCTGNTTAKVTGETCGSNIAPAAVRDNAGNSTSCSSVLIKVDQTNPSRPSLDIAAYNASGEAAKPFWVANASDHGRICARTGNWTDHYVINDNCNARPQIMYHTIEHTGSPGVEVWNWSYDTYNWGGLNVIKGIIRSRVVDDAGNASSEYPIDIYHYNSGCNSASSPYRNMGYGRLYW